MSREANNCDSARNRLPVAEGSCEPSFARACEPPLVSQPSKTQSDSKRGFEILIESVIVPALLDRLRARVGDPPVDHSVESRAA